MARKREAVALHLIRTVHDATDKLMQWRSWNASTCPKTPWHALR
jgi:hypothetical protein